uniref:Uncharacterized protein LOC114327105 n=1 Tax=Diabrotica virgifera virgifera TaxID=50390 RepID=A0A6P7FKR6_DIAVI
MSKRKNIIMALAKENKVVCVQEVGDLEKRYSELASFGQDCLKSIQDTVKDDYLVDNLMMDGLQNQNDNDNPSTNENHFYDIQPICLVRDIRKEENTKVYTELKPLPLIDGTKDGSQNDTDVNNECHKEKSVDVIDVCQHNKDDTVDDDSDLDPSYDPQESEEISYETKKKRRIAKFFQTENEKSVVGTVMENEGLVDKQLKDINQETLPEAQISDKTDEGYEKNRKKEQEQRKSKLRGI